jgi:integrase
MKIPAGQKDIAIAGFPGLYLRPGPGGRKAWCIIYRLNGKAKRWTFGTYPGTSIADAHDKWREVRIEIEAGRDPSLSLTQKRASTTFVDVAAEWLKRDQAENRTKNEAKRIIDKYVVPAWSGLDIHEIGRRQILDLTDSIKDQGKPIQALRVHARLHRLFRWAVSRGILQMSPMMGMDKPASEVKRDRVLTDGELVAVWRGAEQLGFPFGTAVQFLILTGARREEIGQLKWSEIADNTISLKGDRTKNGKPHDIPLSAPALAILKDVPRIGDSDYVFTTNAKTPISGWSRAKSDLDKAASVTDWRIHDLRRVVATGLQKLGTPLQVTEAVLGHISGSRAGIVGVYQKHAYADEKRVALDAWGRYVMALTDEPTRKAVTAELNKGDDEARKRSWRSFKSAISEGEAAWQAYLASITSPGDNVRRLAR